MLTNFGVLKLHRVRDFLGSGAGNCRRRILAADKNRRHEERHFIDKAGVEQYRCQRRSAFDQYALN